MKRDRILASWVELEGCLNFRDLGGYAVEDGRRVRRGHVFRSDGLQHLTGRDVAHLRESLGLRGVIDLRSQNEVEADGRGLIARERFTVHHVPLFDATREAREESPRTFLTDMGEFYLFMLLAAGAPIARVVRLLAASEEPFVFHCAAGKDRTGVISAVLLGLLGASRDTIVADYAFTRHNLDRIRARLGTSETYRPLMDELPEGAWEAEPATMESFLDRVAERWGSLGGWARGAGIEDETVEALRRRLLEDG